MSSSIQGLIAEIQPNFEIIQAIKAADQIYFKDKQIYTDIKPEFTSTSSTQENNQQKKSGNEQNQQQNRNKKSSESIEKVIDGDDGQQQGKKQTKKEKRKAKSGGGGNPPQQPNSILKQSADGNDNKSSSKLQQVIQQAKKTVESALNIGSGEGTDQITNGKEAGEEIVKLRKIVDEQQKRLDKLEKITNKLLKSAGLTESDFSD